MMSGAYLGELTRLVAMDFIKNSTLFHGQVPEGFDEPWSFPTRYMSILERDVTEYRKVSLETMLGHYNFEQPPSLQDMAILTRICLIVSTRSALLCSCAIAALIEQQGLVENSKADIVVKINGSTYEFYPFMRERIQRALCKWFGHKISDRIHLEMAHDGGNVGGALIAMLAC